MYAEMIEKVARAIYQAPGALGNEWCGLRAYERSNYCNLARAAIAALSATPQAAQVPAGYALVPVEPTEAMVRAVFNVLPDRRLEGGIRRHHRRRYIAMLAAAQAQGVQS